MEEAAVSATPQSLRFLLAIIKTQSNLSDVRTLWLRNKTYLAEDFHQSAPTTGIITSEQPQSHTRRREATRRTETKRTNGWREEKGKE